jgi:hypothetical protein
VGKEAKNKVLLSKVLPLAKEAHKREDQKTSLNSLPVWRCRLALLLTLQDQTKVETEHKSMKVKALHDISRPLNS